MEKKIEVKESGIHGKGIFSTKNLKKGEMVFIVKGKEKDFFVKSQKDALTGPNWIGIGKNKWIDVAAPAVYLNHSCEPNVGIRGKVIVVALKNIKKGEEILLDYSITERESLWYMNCSCGSKKCRKVIRSIQHLPKEVFHKYMPYVPRFFATLYLRINNENKRINNN